MSRSEYFRLKEGEREREDVNGSVQVNSPCGYPFGAVGEGDLEGQLSVVQSHWPHAHGAGVGSDHLNMYGKQHTPISAPLSRSTVSIL